MTKTKLLVVGSRWTTKSALVGMFGRLVEPGLQWVEKWSFVSLEGGGGGGLSRGGKSHAL